MTVLEGVVIPGEVGIGVCLAISQSVGSIPAEFDC